MPTNGLRPASGRRIISILSGLAVAGTALTALGVAPAQARDTSPVRVTDTGAVPDDGGDDLAAFRKAVSLAQQQGRDVYVPAGEYDLSGVLVLNGVRMGGAGSSSTRLVSTDPDNSAIGLTGDKPVLAYLTHVVAGAEGRSNKLGAQNIVVKDATSFGVVNVRASGARGAGILVRNADQGLITGSTIVDPLADGIHLTSGTTGVYVSTNTVRRTGDDGIAVVSYLRDDAPSSDITITGNSVTDGATRGISVVGGNRVAILTNTVQRSGSAGVYIASEGEWATQGVSDVRVAGNTMQASPVNTRTGHASMLVYSSAQPVDNVWFQGNQVIDSPTYAFGSWTRKTLGVSSGSIGHLVYGANVVVNAAWAPLRLMAGDIEIRDNNEGFGE
ncbi:right-handed parallel beta-helix repeat-containing protein [Nocardioides acrostichi]|uniref:Right-handed parallel beta-helix repeat-containing protein n=1 Tax=Nocardioides acrostichi TaxID=2784339 RepID=A0A930UYP1_9ACTN|nr:right-handed parallel beta-helix repeat-containing protein [Nocardioides acrostichi]MBF4162536.1 right-handed parallel beta-helix repeat-containing protein [Nocardioides acrostichi]